MKKLISLGMVLGLMACAKAPQSQLSNMKAAVNGIIGGDAVSADDPIAHSTVQIYIFVKAKDPQTGKEGFGLNGCTGSLIADDVILTAGHCTQANPRQLFIYFSKDVPADMQAFVDSMTTNPLVRHVVGGVTHPTWAKLTDKKIKNWGDVALLKFEGKAPAGYVPATLVPKEASINDGTDMTLAGFGLMEPMTDEDHVVQSKELRKVTVSVQDAKFSHTEIMLATDQGKGSCHGDSGGPGYVSLNGQNVIAGITSRADEKTDPKGACTGLTIYTAIEPYLSWISETASYLDSADFTPAPIAEPSGM